MGLTAVASIALAAEEPKVVSTSPASNAMVDAGSTQLSVTFDRPMSAGWSFVDPSGSKTPKYVGTPWISSDRRTISVTVELEPDSNYAVLLNSERFKNFKDEAGTPLAPYRFSFKTKP